MFVRLSKQSVTPAQPHDCGCAGVHLICLLFFFIWSEFEFYQEILVTLSAVQLVTKIRPAGAEFNEDRRTRRSYQSLFARRRS